MSRTFCVDFGDLCDVTAHRLKLLEQLKDVHPGFKVTLFTIPERTSLDTIRRAKALGDWVQLAPHGWRHTRGECLAWTDEEARVKIEAAYEKGIDAPVFRAPGWLVDGDVYEACKALNYTVASHKIFRIPDTNALEYVWNGRYHRRLRGVHGHLTKVGDDFIGKRLEEDRYAFPENATFVFPQDVSYQITGDYYAPKRSA